MLTNKSYVDSRTGAVTYTDLGALAASYTLDISTLAVGRHVFIGYAASTFRNFNVNCAGGVVAADVTAYSPDYIRQTGIVPTGASTATGFYVQLQNATAVAISTFNPISGFNTVTTVANGGRFLVIVHRFA
jgi:hypothetical protein